MFDYVGNFVVESVKCRTEPHGIKDWLSLDSWFYSRLCVYILAKNDWSTIFFYKCQVLRVEYMHPIEEKQGLDLSFLLLTSWDDSSL